MGYLGLKSGTVDANQVVGLVPSGLGDINTLTTTDKTSAVNAINEINTKATTASSSATTALNAANAVTFTVNVVNTNTAAVKNNLYVLTASCTLTCPASPSVGDTFQVSNQSGTTTCVIARNGQPINRLAEDMTINADYSSFYLRYINGTVGWITL